MGVYKRGKTWQVVIRIKGHETVCHTFDTKAQAEEWYDETRFEIRRGRYSSRKEVENTTLAEALERYDREILPSKKSQRPVRVAIRQWLSHPLAKRSLASLRGLDIATWWMSGSRIFPPTPFAWIWPFCPICSRSPSRNGE